jgi:uncharacterized ParB-like nuclease family protein
MEFSVQDCGVDVTAPLIYMWEIHDREEKLVGRYVGKANGGDKRPTQHYARNVNKLRDEKPYKKGKNYRRVHYALADAVDAGHCITLTYLCNVPEDVDIFAVESRYIKKYGCDADDGIGLNGKWKGAPREVVPIERAGAAPETADKDIVERGVSQPGTGSSGLDLDDFIEFFEDGPRDVLEMRVNGKSCSVWFGKRRILRAKQDRPGATIWIKRVQSSTPTTTVKFPWDGSDGQLEMALEAERQALRKRGLDPKF